MARNIAGLILLLCGLGLMGWGVYGQASSPEGLDGWEFLRGMLLYADFGGYRGLFLGGLVSFGAGVALLGLLRQTLGGRALLTCEDD